MHRGRRREAQLAAPGQQVHCFLVDGTTEWKIGILQLGKQLAHRSRIDHGAREGVLAERFRFLEHADVQL